jgi:CelD/BcsL family acetyltransferase involved in cellulose biosynthesis
MMQRSITSDEEFLKIKDVWNDLLDKAGIKNIFLTWEWLYSWWESIDKTNKSLKIGLAYKKNRLIGIIPAYVEKQLGIELVRFLGDSLVDSCYLDIICKSKDRKYAVDYLVNNYSKDRLIYLKYASFGSDFKLEKKKLYKQSFDLTVCPTINLPDSAEKFYGDLSKKSRSNLRKTKRKIENNELFSVADFNEEKNILTGLSIVFELNKKRWVRENRLGEFSDDLKSFLINVSSKLVRNGQIDVSVLYKEKTPVSYVLNFYHEEIAYFYSSGYDINDDDHSKFSYGSYLQIRHIESKIDEGFKEYDLLRGDIDYKRKVANAQKRSIGIIIHENKIKFFLYSSLILLMNKASFAVESILPKRIKNRIISFIPKRLVNYVR